MLIYRGQNEPTSSFSIAKGNDLTFSEQGVGLYFFNFEKRKFALVYALDNHKSIFDDSLPDTLDEGYFYECDIKQDESRTLDKLPVSSINNIEDWVDHIIDNSSYNAAFLDKYHGSAEQQYVAFINQLEDAYSIYNLINELFDILEPTCKREFCNAIGELLKEVDSYVAIPNDHSGEVIVFNTSMVNITTELKVSKIELENSKEERIRMASEAATFSMR